MNPTKIAQDFEDFAKWWNFAKSGHTYGEARRHEAADARAHTQRPTEKG